MFALYKKPLSFDADETDLAEDTWESVLLSDDATQITFEALSLDDYTVVSDFLDDVVVKVTPRSTPINSLGVATLSEQHLFDYQSVYVRDAFFHQAPIKRYIESELEISDSNWLQTLCEESLPFREWWHAVSYEFMEKLNDMPMKSALMWQGFSARRLIAAQVAESELAANTFRKEWKMAKEEAGETLIARLDRWFGSDRYFDESNAEYLLTGLETIAKAEGHRRLAAALIHTPIAASDVVKTTVLQRFPYFPHDHTLGDSA